MRYVMSARKKIVYAREKNNMQKYWITNNEDSERYNKEFENSTEARHWIINHLDTSKEWTIFNGLWKHQVNFNYHQIDRDEEDTFNQKHYESFEWFWDKEKEEE